MSSSNQPTYDASQPELPGQNGFIAGLAGLAPETILTEANLATVFGKTRKSIKRAVKRGELPPPIRIVGNLCWTAGFLVEFFNKQLGLAAKQAEETKLRLDSYQPRYDV